MSSFGSLIIFSRYFLSVHYFFGIKIPDFLKIVPFFRYLYSKIYFYKEICSLISKILTKYP
jgi:hypothetical protein